MLREVVIEIESAIQARRQCFAVENDRTNKRRGEIAVLAQQLRQSWMRGTQGYGKIRDPMRAGQQSGQDTGMRSVGNWTGSERLLKTNAVLRQRIERRCLNGLVTVAVDVVRAERVDGDQGKGRAETPCVSRVRWQDLLLWPASRRAGSKKTSSISVA
jgi:hypothetical protein